MKTHFKKTLKEYQVVKIKGYDRNWILLNVTKEELRITGINTNKHGLHAFGGMWYGDDFTDKNSFGKILYIKEKDVEFILSPDARKESIYYVHNLLELNLDNQ